MKIQFVQNLHKLRMMGKHTIKSSIHYQPILLWAIALIQNGQCSLEHGQQRYWIHLQSRVMFLIKAD